ncbi:hypothetical protein MA04_04151 [Alcanivorax balearicus MACL04]|uniref:Tle cognate immunity protein 4 C-terminal domain-containing protein n=1 Tax=Alloalcanivorax balearicus MACL04 TaxID=1177182 RepID=A0ABT2R4Z0_9GAMM|nr:DUF4747 family protein [Alloalcanivorax balearicus]MCU5784851.1 hypothetical protein [Alloalcanivorax balearicus MACL04]
MVREKRIDIGAINITMHPHSPKQYVTMMKDVFKLRKSAQMWGDQQAIITSMRQQDDSLVKGEPPLVGDIFKYTKIDMDGDWFNINNSGFATEEDLDSIKIPEHLKPNSARFSYIFFPDQHLLFYEGYYNGKSLSAGSAERFFERVLNQSSITNKYGAVNVTHVPGEDALDSALKMYHKDYISMEIKRPNPDDHAEVEREVMERMKARNVAHYEQNYKAEKGKSIEIDESLGVMARVAAKNGNFEVRGKDVNGHPERLSTKEHPWRYSEYYNPNVELAFEVFRRRASKMKDTIMEWLKG